MLLSNQWAALSLTQFRPTLNGRMKKDNCTCKHTYKFRSIYVCVAIQLLVSVYLNSYITRVNDQCRPLKRTRRNSAVIENAVTNAADGHVEFFNPKVRADLEDVKINSSAGKRTETGNGTSEGGESANSWLWLTPQSRLPVSAMQSFCSASKTYCGPGLPGSPGVRGENGLKGERGERGFPGPRGPVGPPGDTGLRGPRGDRGAPGVSGLDGRDGVPGEPGLDGRPGRNGLDGTPGNNGIPGNNGAPGENGIPGVPGTNGTDGRHGMTGSPGPMGLKGIQGNPGMKGRPGKNGSNGVPGICVHQVQLKDGSKSSDFLIPPSIVGVDSTFMFKSIVVKEDDNIRLKCATAGYPTPTVSWFKVNDTILLGKFKVESVSGPTLNITHINRSHKGIYMCIADNGIPPSANQTFSLDVLFPPLIRIFNQSVIAAIGSTAYLECEVEASPETSKHWKKGNERILKMSDKYKMSVFETSVMYKTKMQLNITKFNASDIGEYQCFVRNELGKTAGIIYVQYKGGESIIPGVWPEVAVFGKGPPTKESDNELCPPSECYKCPDLKSLKCEQEGISSPLNFIEYRDSNEIAKPLLGNISNKDMKRSLACQRFTIGKAVLIRISKETFGCWMRDSYPSAEHSDDKYWVTVENTFNQLYEFNNKTTYKKNTPSSTYNLDIPFTGNAQVIFNSSFYYNEKDKPNIVRYDLLSNKINKIEAPYLELTSSNLLYTSMYNYMDFSVDDNGMWVIYGIAENNTAVLKLDPYSLHIQMAWNISLKQQKAGDMFIVCGVLYVVDSITDEVTNIRYGFDLFEGKLLEEVNIQFTNPFKKNTMIGYNHKSKELFSWDRGNQLTYPIRYDEPETNSKDDKEFGNSSKDDKEAGGSKTDAQGLPVAAD